MKNVATAIRSTPTSHTHTHTQTRSRGNSGCFCVASEGPGAMQCDSDLETSLIRENKAEQPTNQLEEEGGQRGRGQRGRNGDKS